MAPIDYVIDYLGSSGLRGDPAVSDAIRILQALRSAISEEFENSDICIVCESHPSHGHVADCPFYDRDLEHEEYWTDERE